MSKIIYIKHSNERRRELSIITKMFKSENGRRYLTKSAAFDVAIPHIQKMKKSYEALSDKYAVFGVEINKCEIVDEETIRFEYVGTENLENKIDQLINENKIDEAKKIITDYIDIIKKANHQIEFIMSEGFKNVFGEDIEWGERSYCGIVNDIDRVLSNVFIRDNKYVFVDYEWTFDFAIPVEYIIYRIVHYYLATDVKRSRHINQNDFLYELGFSDDMIMQCEKMERGFQQYIVRGFVPVSYMRSDLLKESIDVKSLVKINEYKKQIKLYFDDGNGLNEKNSVLFSAKENGGRLFFKYRFKENYNGVRIDLTETRSLVVLHKCCIEGKELVELDGFYTNGVNIGKKAYIFTADDPYFGINNKINYESELVIEYSILILNQKDSCSSIENVISEIISESCEKCIRINELNSYVDFLESEIKEYQKSLSWRTTKLIRKIGSILKSGGK